MRKSDEDVPGGRHAESGLRLRGLRSIEKEREAGLCEQAPTAGLPLFFCMAYL